MKKKIINIMKKILHLLLFVFALAVFWGSSSSIDVNNQSDLTIVKPEEKYNYLEINEKEITDAINQKNDHKIESLLLERKRRLLNRIEDNPSIIFESALSADLIRDIPDEAMIYVEKETEATGEISVLASDNSPGDSNHFMLFRCESGKSYKLLLTDNKINKNFTNKEIKISGIVLDNYIVIDNQTLKIPENEATVRAIETENVLIIRHNFDITKTLAFTKIEVENTVFNSTSSANQFFQKNSYGNYGITGEATQNIDGSPIDSKFEPSRDGGCNENTLNAMSIAARAAASNAGYNLNKDENDRFLNYKKIVYLFPQTACTYNGGGWSGLGEVGGDETWINGLNTPRIYAHEIGHNLGLNHAGSLDCGSVTISSSCNYNSPGFNPVGDDYDIMGYRYLSVNHFNASFKAYLGWLPSSKMQTVSTSGTYTIYPYEDTTENIKAIKISKPNTSEYYYLEYRKNALDNFDNDLGDGVTKGVIVHVGKEIIDWPSQLLDMTPGVGSPSDWTDIALSDGAVFYDEANRIRITQTSHNSNSVTMTIEFVPLSPPPPAPVPAVNVPVYRFWNTNGTHFYTASEAEKNNVIAKWPTIYKYEGIAYYVNISNSANNISLYRFWNTNGTHFYTASEAEKNNVIAKWPTIFRLEGVAYKVAASGTPVYRFWNTNGTHFYTASEAEKNNVIARWPNTFKYEGIAYYFVN